MPLLRDVRSLLRRRPRPVDIDLARTQAERLAAIHPASENGEEPATAARAIEAKPLRARGDRTHEEVMGLVRKIGEHLDHQTGRTERLLHLMDRLPEALESLPEINRQNARLLEALHEHFNQAKGREEALNATLGKITESSGRQTEVLGLLQQQLDSGRQTADQLTDTLDTMRQSFGELAESSTQSTDVLSRMAEETTRRESELSTTLGRTQRWLIAAVVCCVAASVAAIASATIAMLG